MKISSFLYCLKQGFKSLHKHKLFTLASVGTIAACIFLISMFYALMSNFQYIVKQFEDQFCIQVYFDEGISDAEIEAIKEKIGARAEVSDIIYTSAEEAWETFKEQYFTEDNMDLAEGFDDDNPLANSASFSIYLNDINMQDAMVEYLEDIDGVRSVKAAQTAATTMSDFAKLIGYISGVIIIVLYAVSIFLISNTITIAISVRSEEIGIMKLIGASDAFVRTPFVVEGVVIGLVGAAIPLIGIYYIYSKVITYMLSEYQALSTNIQFYSVGEVFKTLIPLGLLVGVGIGFIGSRITLRRHLRV